jgi:riboflavin kinase/FMN adenylyltransferase
MNLPAQIDGLERATLPARPLHLAIGMFDGVHLGHRAVVNAAVAGARESGGISAVLTFWPHPSVLFRPESPTKLLQNASTRSRMLSALGVDAVITQSFTTELAAVQAEEFVPWLQRALPHLAAIYVGANFRFGCERRGDVTSLVMSGARHGVRVFSAPRVTAEGEPVSSTRIRTLLEEGKIEAVNTLLGYAYFVEGAVRRGKQLGRTIGFPTLNVPWLSELRPRFGVYAVRVAGPKSAVPLPGVANYGLRPTVEQAAEPLLEVHVLGGSPFDEGDQVKVELLHFLRPEMKFAGLDELRTQIAIDRTAAEAILSKTRS